MKYSQITTSMAKDIAFKLGAVLNNEEATIFADGYNVALLKVNKDMSTASLNNASLSTNSPVIPDGYVFAPIEPTSEMINAALKSHLIVFNPVETYSVMLTAAPKPELTSE